MRARDDSSGARRLTRFGLPFGALVALVVFPTSGVAAEQPPVAAPKAPTPYSLPAGATVVTTSAQLRVALSASTRDIVLADGVYDNAGPFTNPSSSRLYAQHLGGAVLRAGIVFGGNWGPGGGIARGLAFDVSDAENTFQSSEINIWGASGQNTQVLDCTFDGNAAIGTGVLALNAAGLALQRLVLTDFTDTGIRASDNVTVAYGSSTPVIDTITDVSVSTIGRAAPGTSNGTAEAGLWIGHPVRNGVHRIKIRNVAISGIEAVNNAWDTTYTDLDIDLTGSKEAVGVGIYLEHYAYNLVFDGFTIKGVHTGLNAEWADPAWDGRAAAHGTTIENGTIDAAGWTLPGHTAGVYLDEGTDSTTVRNVTFRNQNWAGIGAFKVVGTNSFTRNGFQLEPGASRVSTSHI
jgi:hypothetical protein